MSTGRRRKLEVEKLKKALDPLWFDENGLSAMKGKAGRPRHTKPKIVKKKFEGPIVYDYQSYLLGRTTEQLRAKERRASVRRKRL